MHPNLIINEDLNNICTTALDWSQFDKKTILITGANGFLPAYLVETLLHLERWGIKVKIIALVRNLAKASSKFGHHEQNNALQFLVQDVSEPILIDEKVDYIIHAASQASPKYYGIDPVGTLMANTLGTVNVLELAYRKNVTGMLFISSGEVYGEMPVAVKLIKENNYGYIDPCIVRSCYGESKRMGENMCVSWAAQYGVNVKIVRPFHTYGPGMLLNDGRVFADFVGNIVRNENIELKSDGSAIRAFCYLSDAIKAFFTILLKGKISQAYNMGNPFAAVSIKELANILITLSENERLQVIQRERKNDKEYLKSPIISNIPDIDKLKRLGWEPLVSIKEGFSRTINSYRL